MTMTIHAWKVLHNWASKASLYSTNEDQYIVYNGNPFIPGLTSLEEGASSRIYTICRASSPVGVQFLMESSEINWWRVHQCRTEAELSLLVNRGPDLADTSTHTLPHWPIEHPGESTRVEEREGAIPNEYHCRLALDLIWSPPLVKDLSDPVNLLQIWLISVKSVENPLSYLILDLLHYSSIY